MQTVLAETSEAGMEESLWNGLPDHVKQPRPESFLSDNYWTLDWETTNLDYGDPCNSKNRLLLGVAKHGRTSETIVRWGSEFEQQELVEKILDADFIVAQNAKFELGWLSRCGVDISRVLVYDTVLGQYVYDGNRKSQRTLDSLAKFYGVPGKESVVKRLIEDGVCPSGILPEWLEEYCIQDVETEDAVFKKQRQLIHSLGLLPCVYTRCLLTPVLADIEFNGMKLDEERVNLLYRKALNEYNEAKIIFDRLSGGINPNSPKQLAELLYDRLGFSEPKDFRGNAIRTASGGRSTDQKSIKLLRARTSKQREFLGAYTKVSKLETLVSKYLAKCKECCEQDRGILQAKFNQAVTQTHRLSSTGGKYKIQFQNMDRKLKPLFKARHEGWFVGEADLAQLEFRTAVWLGDDDIGRQKILEKFDVHRYTADVMSDAGQPPCGKHQQRDSSCPDCRQEAKPHTFKPLYGGQSGTDAERAYYAAFRQMYPGITGAQNAWIQTVLKDKCLIMPHGFRFYWNDTRVTSTGYITNTTSICNYPVQHFATAEIVPIGVVYLWHRMRLAKTRSFLINTIHDSSVAEVHPDEKELYEKLAVQSFNRDTTDYLKKVYNVEFDVPLETEVKFGRNWAESKKWADTYLNPEKRLVE